MEFTKPAVEYAQLWPLFLVFGAACLGIVLEAFLPRATRYLAQTVLAVVRCSPRWSAPSWSAATSPCSADGVARGNLAMEAPSPWTARPSSCGG